MGFVKLSQQNDSEESESEEGSFSDDRSNEYESN